MRESALYPLLVSRATPAVKSADGKNIPAPSRVLGALGVGFWGAGGGVLSHRVSPAVPSALRGLTAVFGMGTGVALSLSHQPRVLGEGVRGCRVRWALGLGGLGHSLVVRSRGGDGAPAVSSGGGEERAPVKPHGQLVRLGSRLTPLAPAAYRRGSLPRPSGCLRSGSAHLGVGFPLRCFQRLSRPDVATRRCRWRDSRYTSGRSIPVLSY